MAYGITLKQIYTVSVYPFMKRVVDISGNKYGRLLVLERAAVNKPNSYWKCKCECGNEKIVAGAELKRGHVKSCGCLRLDSVYHIDSMHGLYNHPLHSTWAGMKERTNNPNFKQYKDYGGKGIKVCDDWQKFKAFYDWAISSGWVQGLTIDRIDPDKGYSPDNCIWATRIEQANHTSRNKMITYGGKTQSMANWARELNMPYGRLQTRIKRGWPIEKAFETPKLKGGKYNVR